MSAEISSLAILLSTTSMFDILAVNLTKVQTERALKRAQEQAERKAREEEERQKRAELEVEERRRMREAELREQEEERRRLFQAGWMDESKVVRLSVGLYSVLQRSTILSAVSIYRT